MTRRRRLPGEPTAIARITRITRREAERLAPSGITEEAIDHIQRHAEAAQQRLDDGNRDATIAHLTAAASAAIALAAQLDEEEPA